MGQSKDFAVTIKCDGIEETTQKTVNLIEKMQEAKSLADELTTCISNLHLEIKF